MALRHEVWTALGALTPLGTTAPAAGRSAALAWFPLVGVALGACAVVTVAAVERLAPLAAGPAGVLALEVLGGGRPERRGLVLASAALIVQGSAAAALAPPARAAVLLLAPMLGRWAFVVQRYGGVGLEAGEAPERAGFREFGIASTIAFAITMSLGRAAGVLLLVLAAAMVVVLRVAVYRGSGRGSRRLAAVTETAVETLVFVVPALLG